MSNRITAATQAATLALALIGTCAAAEENAGAYLAARQASIASDFAAASDYFQRALVPDPSNPVLLENAVTAHLGAGEMDRAVELARRLLQVDHKSQIAGLALTYDAARRGDWDSLVTDIEAGQSVGPLFDDLVHAWALVGAGRFDEAVTLFDKVSGTKAVEPFGLFHKALALASAGDFEGAETLLSGDAGAPVRLTRRGIVAFATILSQLERDPAAVELIDKAFGTALDPALSDLRDQLAAGETVPFTAVGSATDGIAEVFFSIANALNGEAADAYTLIYARVASELRPDHTDALLLTAALLEHLDQHALATQVYDKVGRDDPAFAAAEVGRAEALEKAGNPDAAIEVLTQLAKAQPDLASVHITLGDLLRRLERYADSLPAYDRAVELLGEPDRGQWMVYFSRGISLERTDAWDRAEADFREALKLNPDQPQVLNYLGYSMVEKGQNLDEALGMIERAVAGRPDSGYITDSLGWVFYRLGRYEEAVVQMERAVELEPIDPVITDHLADVYWAVGRQREAEFQWHRALSFDPDAKDAERIRRKLEIGLDKVLEEEGQPPLRVANDRL